MRILSWICIILLGIVKANAQVTLSAADYPSETLIGIDSLKKSVYNSPFPALNGGSDVIWDMSVVVDTAPQFFNSRVYVSGYQYADSINADLASFVYTNKNLINVTTVSLVEIGRDVESESYSLTWLTTDPTDSLFIPTQTNLYSASRKVIAFPCTYLSAWSSQYSSDFHFELSIAGYSLTHAPAIRRTYTEESSTVTGYGKMRVKDAAGGPSSYFNVLQVKTVTTTVDSFFLNGSPMSAALLGLFMSNQGQKDTIREHKYYRKGEITPLAKVEFRDDGFNQPYKATTHMQRLISVGVQSTESGSLSIFPNPASNYISVDLPFPANWQYHLIDILGRTVDQGTFSNKQPHRILLSPSIPNGHYMLRINDGNTTAIEQIDIIK